MDVILETLRNDVTRHAAFVHFPIVLSIVTAVLAVIAGCCGARGQSVRGLAVFSATVLTVSAFFATGSGEDAHAQMTRNLAAASWDLVAEHETMASRVWVLAAGAALLLAVGLGRKEPVRSGATWLGVITALACAGWVTQVAHRGGQLVYDYGVGTPNPVVVTDASDALGSAGAVDPRLMHFRDNVLPIFETKCLRCHHQGKARGGIDLTSVTSILRTVRDGARVVVPGDSESSIMMRAIRRERVDFEMPPDESLSTAEIAAIEQWIRDGAVWE